MNWAEHFQAVAKQNNSALFGAEAHGVTSQQPLRKSSSTYPIVVGALLATVGGLMYCAYRNGTLQGAFFALTHPNLQTFIRKGSDADKISDREMAEMRTVRSRAAWLGRSLPSEPPPRRHLAPTWMTSVR